MRLIKIQGHEEIGFDLVLEDSSMSSDDLKVISVDDELYEDLVAMKRISKILQEKLFLIKEEYLASPGYLQKVKASIRKSLVSAIKAEMAEEKTSKKKRKSKNVRVQSKRMR